MATELFRQTLLSGLTRCLKRRQPRVLFWGLPPEKLLELVKYVHDWLYGSEPGKRRRPSLIKRAEGDGSRSGGDLLPLVVCDVL